MHYYLFNIGDYKSHTDHLEPLEDLAYRRMLDWCYLHESPLPEDVNEIAKKICMRTHSDCIACVLNEFFTLKNNGWQQDRIKKEIKTFHSKSEKAKASAKARWSKKPNKNKDKDDDANVMRTHSERNAKQETVNTKQEPLNKKQETLNKYMAFEDFWALWPKKTDKKKAEQVWKRLKVTDELFQKITLHCSTAFVSTEKQYIPNPSTYLNGEKWNDEIITNQPSSKNGVYQNECAQQFDQLFGNAEDNSAPIHENGRLVHTQMEGSDK